MVASCLKQRLYGHMVKYYLAQIFFFFAPNYDLLVPTHEKSSNPVYLHETLTLDLLNNDSLPLIKMLN